MSSLALVFGLSIEACFAASADIFEMFERRFVSTIELRKWEKTLLDCQNCTINGLSSKATTSFRCSTPALL